MSRRMMTKRVLRSNGINFAGMQYYSPDFALLHRTTAGQHVCVFYDPNDIQQIWVLDPHADQHLEVPMPGYPPLTPLPLIQQRARRQQDHASVHRHTFPLKRAVRWPISDTVVTPAQPHTARSSLPPAPRERMVPPVIVVVQMAPDHESLAALLRSVIEQFTRD